MVGICMHVWVRGSSLMVKVEPYERGMVKTNVDLGVWVHGEPWGMFTTSPT
jgi:hypothetical protein